MIYQIGDWSFDSDKGLLCFGEKVQQPRLKVLQVLTILLQNRTRIVTRSELIQSVWQGNELTGSKALNSVIYTLRNLLKPAIKGVEVIQTIPKQGYRLVVNVVEIPPTISTKVIEWGASMPVLGKQVGYYGLTVLASSLLLSGFFLGNLLLGSYGAA